MSTKTKQAIVAMALDMVGNPRLQTMAEAWLEVILKSTARRYRFPEVEKQHSVAVTAGVDAVAYPSDYGFLVKDRTSRAEGIYVSSGETDGTPIYLASLGATRDSSAHSGLGVPTNVADDANGLQWILHPTPSPSGTVKLNYNSIPADVASDATVWFPDDEALIEAICFIAERRQRGGQVTLATALREATMRLARASPSRAHLWLGGSGSGLDSSIFK
jgi:hypothetical protein